MMNDDVVDSGSSAVASDNGVPNSEVVTEFKYANDYLRAFLGGAGAVKAMALFGGLVGVAWWRGGGYGLLGLLIIGTISLIAGISVYLYGMKLGRRYSVQIGPDYIATVMDSKSYVRKLQNVHALHVFYDRANRISKIVLKDDKGRNAGALAGLDNMLLAHDTLIERLAEDIERIEFLARSPAYLKPLSILALAVALPGMVGGMYLARAQLSLPILLGAASIACLLILAADIGVKWYRGEPVSTKGMIAEHWWIILVGVALGVAALVEL